MAKTRPSSSAPIVTGSAAGCRASRSSGHDPLATTPDARTTGPYSVGDPVTGVGDEPVRRRESRDHPALCCLSLDPDRDCQCAPSDPPPSTRGPYRSRRGAAHGVGTAAEHPTVPLSCRAMAQPDRFPPQRRPASRLDAEGRRQVAPTWESLVERQLREAMDEGKFDDLPFRGERIPFDDDAAAGDWALAFHMLRNAGVAPPWIEADKDVRTRARPARGPAGAGREVARIGGGSTTGSGDGRDARRAKRTPRSRG